MPQRYRIHITDEALADVKSIFDYISQHSPENAARVIRRILAGIDDLQVMPAGYRIVGRSRKHGTVVHARSVRPFIVYFRVDEPEFALYVLTVRHGARRQPKRFE